LSVPQIRRLTDHRSAGTLLRWVRSDTHLTGQGVRYAMSGVVVACVYLLTTTVLAVVVGVPFQVALLIGFVLAVSVHFTLQRLFVWVHHEEFALPFRHQARRYLMVVLWQYGVTAASTALLPAVLGLPTEVVYLIIALLLASANFLLFRSVVFHPERTTSVRTHIE
jgi:putative flippase GtrA